MGTLSRSRRTDLPSNHKKPCSLIPVSGLPLQVIPLDVNLDSMEDILLGMHQGIVKLQGYKLSSEGVYRLPDTVETDGKAFTFYKKVDVFTEFPTLDQKDFSEAVQDLLERARNQSINRAVITTIEGKTIKHEGGKSFIDWTVKCHACGKELKGRRPVSYSNGVPSRAQMFVADEKGVTRYREGSKYRLCPACSVTSIPVPEALQPVPVASVDEVVAAPVKATDPVSEKTSKVVRDEYRKDLEELLAASKHDSGVSLEYFKGMVYGVVKSILKG